MRRSSILFGLLVAACPLVLVSSPASAAGVKLVTAAGPLRDLDLSSAVNPTDGASARFVSVGVDGSGTRAVLIVTGLDRSKAGTTLGAHVHTGTCVAGAPLTAGPHYNSGGPADAEHEVWLDFTISAGGTGMSRASVPFTIAPGAASAMVIHAMATQPGGGAGPRLACLPVIY